MISSPLPRPGSPPTVSPDTGRSAHLIARGGFWEGGGVPDEAPVVAAVVLAAGGGRRYGMPKALVEYDGSLLVERAVRTAQEVCDPVLVVLGAQAVDVWRQADLGGAVVLANKDWESGMASSLRTGLDGLRGWPGRVDAALVLLVDMPGMTTDALQRMAERAAPDALAVAAYD